MKNTSTNSLQFTALRSLAASAVLVFLLSIIATGGCSSSSTNTPSTPSPVVSPTPRGSVTASPSPSPTPTPVNFVIMAYSSIKPTIDPTYGEINGYGQATAVPTGTPLPTVISQIVTVHCNQTIAFYNLDRALPHTASLLAGPTPPPWPLFNNVNGITATPQFTAGQLTPITYPQFSTGLLTLFGSGSSTSLVYSTGATAGIFFYGDAFNYAFTPPMRTAINILCP
ncbi:MAG: hypothetical protein JOZ91_11970 [Candidatus Eremiobacteraeota bacterium]|nr:hypothetical protein [Candidatus Eremiobacteraeota bacterium]